MFYISNTWCAHSHIGIWYSSFIFITSKYKVKKKKWFNISPIWIKTKILRKKCIHNIRIKDQ